MVSAMPLGSSFPFSFGFVPNTLADDGDPLDIVLPVDGIMPEGTIVPSRLVEVLPVRQDNDGDGEKNTRNDRILAVPTLAQTYGHVDDVCDFEDMLVDKDGERVVAVRMENGRLVGVENLDIQSDHVIYRDDGPAADTRYSRVRSRNV